MIASARRPRSRAQVRVRAAPAGRRSRRCGLVRSAGGRRSRIDVAEPLLLSGASSTGSAELVRGPARARRSARRATSSAPSERGRTRPRAASPRRAHQRAPARPAARARGPPAAARTSPPARRRRRRRARSSSRSLSRNCARCAAANSDRVLNCSGRTTVTKSSSRLRGAGRSPPAPPASRRCRRPDLEPRLAAVKSNQRAWMPGVGVSSPGHGGPRTCRRRSAGHTRPRPRRRRRAPRRR